MKTPFFSPAVLAPAALCIGAFFLSASSAAHADSYRGPIRLRGTVQNEAKPGSITFIISGTLSNPLSGKKVSVTGGGLFRSTSDEVVDAVFKGPLKINVNKNGKISRTRDDVTVRVSRRFIKFPRGKVKLKRPLSSTEIGKQHIRGRGTLRVTTKN